MLTKRLFQFLPLLITALFLLASLPSFAIVYYVKMGGDDTKNGQSWPNAFKTVQKALSVANSGDDIWVAAGTYYPDEGGSAVNDDRTSSFSMKAGVAILGGFDGVSTNLGDRDPDTYATILSGDLKGDDGSNFANNGDNTYHVVWASGASITVTSILDGVTITAGNANGSGNDEEGGGIHIRGGATPLIQNCTLLENFANVGGGARVVGTSPHFNHCKFLKNKSIGRGGGMSLTGGGTTVVDDCLFQENEAAQGGGIDLFTGNPTLELSNSILRGNTIISFGAGVNTLGGNCTIINTQITGNTSTTNGVAVHVLDAVVDMINCTVSGNFANQEPALYTSSTGTLNLINCIYWGNDGPIENRDDRGATTTINNSLIEGGNAGVDGTFSGSGNIDADPLFVSTPDFNLAPTIMGDVHLQACSPAIDVGTNTGAPSDDLDGNTRPVNSRGFAVATTDMGAYEYQSAFPNPIAICQGVTTSLDVSGNASVAASELDNGSTGCDLSFLVDGGVSKNFDCNNLGGNTVTLTVTDRFGNTNTCTTTVTLDGASGPEIYVYVNAAGDNNGSSWANAFNHLQDALDYAITCPGITEIWVAKGTYYPDEGVSVTDNDRAASFHLINDVAIYGGFDGPGDTQLSDRDPVNNVTTLSGDLMQNDGANFANNGDNAAHVVEASGSSITNTAILDGFTVTAGNADGVGVSNQGGGCLINNNAAPTINDCIFLENFSDRQGGGCRIGNSNPRFLRCKFQKNKCDYRGGGVYINRGNSSFVDCIFQENEGTEGGGFFNQQSASLTIEKCIFEGNKANGPGGGIMNIGGASSISNTLFTGNFSGANGAALQIIGGNVEVTNSTVSGNFATSDFRGNNLVILVTSAGTLDFKNSIHWGNNGVIENSDVFGATTTINNSLIEGGNSGVRGTFTGSGNIDADPLFVSTPDFNLAPTTTGDVHLQDCSPAVDVGTNTGAPIDDLDGNARPFNATGIPTATTDMGAYEYQSAFPDPVAICQSVTVSLDASGNASVVATEIDNGSSDGCSPYSFLVNGNASQEFDCGDTGPNVVTLMVTDVVGNTSACTATVLILDDTAPAISCPSNITQDNDTDNCSAVVNYTAPVGTDNCTNPTTNLTTGLGDGGTFAVGTHVETYTVTDASGNTASCSFTVTINDTELPVINCPGNITQDHDAGNCSAVVTYTAPVGTDNCPSTSTALTNGLGSGGTFPVGSHTETYTVTDAAGNTASCSFLVTINDTEDPAFTCPSGNLVRNTDPGSCDHEAVGNDLDPGVSDNCQLQTVTNDYNNANSLSGAVFSKGRTTVTWTATDVSGNSSTCSYNIRIRDREAPDFDNCPDDSTITVPFQAGGSYYTFPALTATDNCNPLNRLTITGFPLSGSFCATGVTTFNWTATDRSNNVSNCDFDITVVEQGAAAPSGWSNGGVGNAPSCATNWDANTASLQIQANGGNVSGTTDNFCSINFSESSSAIDFRARVTPAGNSYYDQVGIMMRQSMVSNSTHATMALTGTNVPIMTARFSTGGFPLSTSGITVSRPYWLRLYRLGSTITGYVSADGVTWTTIMSYPNVLSSPLELVLFSTTSWSLGVSTFDNISVNGTPLRSGHENLSPSLGMEVITSPNPFADYLKVEVNQVVHGRCLVKLVNVLGQEVYRMEAKVAPAGTIEQRISLEHLPAGTYLLEVRAGGQRKTIKVQKF